VPEKNPLLSREFSARDKVASRVKQTLGKCMQRLRDPGLGMVSVNGLMLSPDMRSARVYVSVMGCTSESEATQSLAALTRARGFLQQELKSNCRLRVVPKLTFFFDKTIEGAMRVDSLLRDSQTDKTSD
jgi:ribosome-binding factor A